MSSYGSVHLPSLLVFIRPQPSAVEAVARGVVDVIAVRRGGFEDVAPRLSGLSERERQEVVLRLTSLTHEVRHFHDFLLTPYGNQLVRDAFWYSILTFGALTELTGGRSRAEPIEVDLPVDPAALPRFGKRLMAMRAGFNERVKCGLSLMEADAILAQRYEASDDLGESAAQIVVDALQRMPAQYRDATGALLRLQKQLVISDREFAPIGHSLILMCLLDPDPGGIDDVVAALLKSAAGLFGEDAALRIQAAIAPTVQHVFRRAMATAQAENEKFLKTIQAAVPEPLRGLVLPAFEDFVRAAAEIQRDFLEYPARWLDPELYLRSCVAEAVFPFVYLLAEGGTTMQVQDRDWRSALADPLTNVEEYRVSGRTFYILRCVPAPTESMRTLDAEAWKNFADSVAGSLVIAEGASRDDPVEGMWIRKMEERWPVRFTPFGDRRAWRGVVPSGVLV